MAASRLMVVLAAAVVVAVALAGGSEAITLCKMSDDQLTACKPAVTKPDPAEPTPECCAALSAADLGCLCSYKNSAVLPALGIDPGLAMGLPAKCGLTPPADC
ncbi:putative lipid-transfer protein DIR1 [Rhodamnia argentea]|uniref:Lipid-transfer protein DIR1 n=1 Tax=Rhodamnia argentea TaxID=178133 RepID=A0A8B8QKP2_9MYRT|nr:putative lipid-transfer protein DIR1 [Rhodamnia argentea]